MRKFINIGMVVLILCAGAAAQQIERKKGKIGLLTGTVKGTVVIKQMSGNNLGNFGCSNLRVTVSSLNVKEKWSRSRTTGGNIRTLRCSFQVTGVPSEDQFIVSVAANFPKGCDLKVFKVEGSFPTKIKGGETLTYDPVVTQIKCEIVK